MDYRDAEKSKREREAETLDLRKKLNSKEFTVEEQVPNPLLLYHRYRSWKFLEP